MKKTPDFDKKIAEYIRTLSRNPDHTFAHNSRGYAYSFYSLNLLIAGILPLAGEERRADSAEAGRTGENEQPKPVRNRKFFAYMRLESYEEKLSGTVLGREGAEQVRHDLADRGGLRLIPAVIARRGASKQSSREASAYRIASPGNLSHARNDGGLRVAVWPRPFFTVQQL